MTCYDIRKWIGQSGTLRQTHWAERTQLWYSWLPIDLHEPDRDYSDVISCIKGLGPWCHLEESVWLVDTVTTPAEVRDALKVVGTDATYFVQRVTRNWASFGESQDKIEWLRADSRTW
jgi:hypothetical protein